jgi:hypothetical protein
MWPWSLAFCSGWRQPWGLESAWSGSARVESRGVEETHGAEVYTPSPPRGLLVCKHMLLFIVLPVLLQSEVDVEVGAADGRLEVGPGLVDAAHAELLHAEQGAGRVVAGGGESALM